MYLQGMSHTILVITAPSPWPLIPRGEGAGDETTNPTITHKAKYFSCKILKHVQYHNSGTRNLWRRETWNIKQKGNTVLARWFVIGGRAWVSMHCWFNVLSWHTNLGICHCLLFHEHGKQNFMQPFLRSRKLLRYTHAWTKLHNKVTSWISGAYECNYAWPLPEANATTVHDLTVPSVSSLPLSVIVCNHIQ